MGIAVACLLFAVGAVIVVHAVRAWRWYGAELAGVQVFCGAVVGLFGPLLALASL